MKINNKKVLLELNGEETMTLEGKKQIKLTVGFALAQILSNLGESNPFGKMKTLELARNFYNLTDLALDYDDLDRLIGVIESNKLIWNTYINGLLLEYLRDIKDKEDKAKEKK